MVRVLGFELGGGGGDLEWTGQHMGMQSNNDPVGQYFMYMYIICKTYYRELYRYIYTHCHYLSLYIYITGSVCVGAISSLPMPRVHPVNSPVREPYLPPRPSDSVLRPPTHDPPALTWLQPRSEQHWEQHSENLRLLTLNME